MKKLIKNANDFVLAVLMLALSLFLLLYPNITSNIPSVSMGGYFTRPDVYIRMLALFLAAASLALLIRSLNLGRKSQQTSGFHFTINSTVIMTVAALLPVSYTHLDVYKRQGWPLVYCTQFQLCSKANVIKDKALAFACHSSLRVSFRSPMSPSASSARSARV